MLGDLLIEAPLIMWILTEEQYFLKPRDMNEVVEDGDLVDRSEAKIRKQFKTESGQHFKVSFSYIQIHKEKQRKTQPCLLKTR